MTEPIYLAVATCKVCNRELARAENVPQSQTQNAADHAAKTLACPGHVWNANVNLQWFTMSAPQPVASPVSPFVPATPNGVNGVPGMPQPANGFGPVPLGNVMQVPPNGNGMGANGEPELPPIDPAADALLKSHTSQIASAKTPA